MATLSFTKAQVGAPDISFGTGTFVRKKSDGTYMNVNQVNAASIPLFDVGCHFSATAAVGRRVEYGLGHCASRIDTVSASLTTGLSGKVSTSVTTSISATLASTVKYWWKSPMGTIYNSSATRIVFPSGYYPVGGKIYYAANTVGWSFQRGGGSVLTQKWSNRGFSFATGAVALNEVWSKPSTWYYAYATTYASSLAFVVAGTVPTSKYDTGLTGSSWDTNTYLCAFRTASSASEIVDFVQTGNQVYLREESTGLRFVARQTRSASITNALPIICRIPDTTELARVHTKGRGASGGTLCTLQIGGDANCADIDYMINTDAGGTEWRQVPVLVNVRASTKNVIYWKHTQSTTPSSIVFVTRGWYDKFA